MAVGAAPVARAASRYSRPSTSRAVRPQNQPRAPATCTNKGGSFCAAQSSALRRLS